MAHILVIDDDDGVREFLKEALKKAGHQVTLAPDGITGIRLYGEELFDLVITDMVMPEYSGIDTIKYLKRLNPDVKIIAISGGGEIEPERYLFLAEVIGAQHVLYKPFTSEEILKLVTGLL